jgi:hypothetical protein
MTTFKQFRVSLVFFLVYFLLALLTAPVEAQEQKITNPNQARLITSDIDHFWQMFDQLPQAKSEQDTLAILKQYYLNKASKGLQNYFEREQKNNKTNIEQQYLTILRTYPTYLVSIRENTQQVKNLKGDIITSFIKQKTLYPGIHFPDTYFCIGFFNSGGTSLESGLYVGVEIACALDNANYEEWGENSWIETLDRSLESITGMVVHENIHAQQRLRIDLGKSTLLCNALQEGGAVFITDLINKGKQRAIDYTRRAYEYGNAHEKQVWQAFKQDMLTTKWRKWFYNQATADFPNDMGYYVGYKICQSYYQNAKDKKQAIQDIIEVSDCEDFLQKSKYEEKFYLK